jgi:hypothetical protein
MEEQKTYTLAYKNGEYILKDNWLKKESVVSEKVARDNSNQVDVLVEEQVLNQLQSAI